MCGISAGPETETKLGDVYISRQVWDVAGGRAEPTGVRPRPVPFSPRDPVAKQIDYIPNRIGENSPEWRAGIATLAKKLRQEHELAVPTDRQISAQRFRVAAASIICGEEVMADGRLPDYVSDLDQLIRVGEMEGSGFAQACEDHNLQWVVFRAIVDFGDPSKAKKWQSFGAGIAALAARRYLETEFRLDSEIIGLEAGQKF